MNKEKLCPIFSVADAIAGCEEDCECQKEKCAWWIEDKQKCAITVTGSKLWK